MMDAIIRAVWIGFLVGLVGWLVFDTIRSFRRAGREVDRILDEEDL